MCKLRHRRDYDEQKKWCKHHYQGCQLNAKRTSTRKYLRGLGNLCSSAPCIGAYAVSTLHFPFENEFQKRSVGVTPRRLFDVSCLLGMHFRNPNVLRFCSCCSATMTRMIRTFKCCWRRDGCRSRQTVINTVEKHPLRKMVSERRWPESSGRYWQLDV